MPSWDFPTETHRTGLVRPHILLFQQLQAQSMDQNVSPTLATMPCCFTPLCGFLSCPVTDKNPQQKQWQQTERQGSAISRYYPVTERITVLTFKTLCWLLMISGKGNVSKYRHHLSIQQTSLLSQEFSQFKLNCADQQLLEEATFLFKSI